MKKIAIILSFCCVLAFVSCEGFLDVSPSNQADSSTCITSESDAQVMINGLMRKMTWPDAQDDLVELLWPELHALRRRPGR